MDFGCTEACYSDNLNVLKTLLNNPNYSVAINPSTGSGSPFNILLSFFIGKLLELSAGGTIKIVGSLIFMWTDPRLAWNSSEHRNLSVIEVPAYAIWTPQLSIVNGVAENLQIPLKIGTVASLSSSGSVLLSLAGQFKATCTTDLTDFPFDSQNCTLQFVSIDLRSSYQSINFVVDPRASQIATVMYTPTGEYSLDKVQLSATSNWSSSVGIYMPTINLTLSFTRYSNYYTTNVGFPSISLLVTATFAFFLPSDNTVKITMTCSLMIAMYVLQQNVARILPAIKTTPLLAIGMTVELWLGGLVVLGAVFTTAMYKWQPQLPPILGKFVAFFDSSLREGPEKQKLELTSVDDAALSKSANEEQDDSDSNATTNEDLYFALSLLVKTLIADRKEAEEVAPATLRSRQWRVVDIFLNCLIIVIMAIATVLLCSEYFLGYKIWGR